MTPPKGPGSTRKSRDSAVVREAEPAKKRSKERPAWQIRGELELERIKEGADWQRQRDLDTERDSDPETTRKEVISRLKSLRNKWPNLELRGFRSPEPLGLRWPPSAPGRGRIELHVTCDLVSAEIASALSGLAGAKWWRAYYPWVWRRLMDDLAYAFKPFRLENDLWSVVHFADHSRRPDAELRLASKEATSLDNPDLRDLVNSAEAASFSMRRGERTLDLNLWANSLPKDYIHFRAAWRRLFEAHDAALVIFFWDSPAWALHQSDLESALESPWSAQRGPNAWLSLSDLLDPGLADEAVEPQHEPLKPQTPLGSQAAPTPTSAPEPDVFEQATLPKASTTAALVEIIAAKAPALAERLKQHHRGPATAEEIGFLRDAFAHLRAVGVYPTIEDKDEVRADIMGVLQAVGARLVCQGKIHSPRDPVPAVLSVNRVTRRGSFFFSHLREDGGCRRQLPVGSAEADRLPLLEPIPWQALTAGRRPKTAS